MLLLPPLGFQVRHCLAGALIIATIGLIAGCASGPPAPIVSRTSPGSPSGTAQTSASGAAARPATPAAPSPAAPSPTASRTTPDAAGVQSAPVRSGSIDAKAIESRPLGSTPAAPSTQAAPAAPATVAPAAGAGAAAATPPVEVSKSDIEWSWPSAGRVVQSFNDSNSKGMSFATGTGDSVLAAADGRVIFSGVGPRGYGNLVIVKHTNDLLSVYAHNRSLMVKEGTTVKRGQKIAEAGDSSAGTQRLHFEIRQQGKPVDPARYLPKR
jgi:lipoprotein NlpD